MTWWLKFFGNSKRAVACYIILYKAGKISCIIYALYKNTKLQRTTTGNKIFDIKIDPLYIDKLNNCTSIEV